MVIRHDLVRSSAAEFSPCMRYRYRLRRCFTGDVLAPPATPVAFVMLNPSTADALVDDQTIRKCRLYARSWGHSDLLVVNMFAWRSTDPDELPRVGDPVGPENDAVLESLPLGMPVIAAWGAHKAVTPARLERVLDMLRGRDLLCLRRSEKTGAPWHPLYLPMTARPIAWRTP